MSRRCLWVNWFTTPRGIKRTSLRFRFFHPEYSGMGLSFAEKRRASKPGGVEWKENRLSALGADRGHLDPWHTGG